MKKRDYSEIDPQIAPLVAAFNQAGFITYASCQGHGWPVHDIKPYIAFQAEMTQVRPFLSRLRQDALSTRPQLRWGWNITGHFNCELVLCFRLAPEGPHRKHSQYLRASLIHDFKVISTWLF